MSKAIQGIGSMATRGLMLELTAAYTRSSGVAVAFESVGGVEAARRVSSGELFDLMVLASDAIDKLAAAGKVDASRKVDVVRSGVAVAVHASAARPDISSEDAVRRAVLEAESIAYSTGPSGVALMTLFERWGIAGTIGQRLVQAPVGVSVGSLVARGEAALGFQQLSELMGVEGIALLGPLPAEIQITTTFSAAPGVGASQRDAVIDLLACLTSKESEAAKRQFGMEPAGS
ncbi:MULTISPECIES: substrate-binding domain-containing protein [Variovorax]|jgi:molybdate transport system substrate-binding protein|uniref:substrate-binding domain-containing protein n=1 Tax=Variovorax TaxID=34072 RepID=UPI000B24AEA4|nr:MULTISPECIES: substrate-binding domain-containing protein [Variovorax]MBN8758260.1 substrate-binding domain-containing protein [Variovorax sp.]UKI05565.1 substrate-binding domain-containing protein [Variovorax paradoxus]